MAISEAHVSMAEHPDLPSSIDPTRVDEDIGRLTSMSAGIHAQRAADATRDSSVKGKPIDASVGCRTGDLHVRHGGAGSHPIALLDRDGAKAFAPEADDHAGHAAVA